MEKRRKKKLKADHRKNKIPVEQNHYQNSNLQTLMQGQIINNFGRQEAK